MSNKFSGTKKGLIPSQFNDWRKELNMVLLLKNIRLIQPGEHFFRRVIERNIDIEQAKKIIKSGIIVYSKRILDTVKPVSTKIPFTLIWGNIAIPLIVEMSERTNGTADDASPTCTITAMTIFEYKKDRRLTKFNIERPLYVP